MTTVSVIDACVHHHWARQADVMEYMSRGWQAYLRQPESLPGNLEPIGILPWFPYRRPDGDKLVDAVPESGGAGSSYELTSEQIFGRGVEAAVLNYDDAMRTPAAPNTHLAREVARAANNWTIDRWLSRDDRLHGLVLVPNQVTEDAVREIKRVGEHRQMAGILMSANGLSKPFGHPAYHPIYAAAAELGLPVVIHAGGDALLETLTHTTAGGLPTTYAEYYVFASQPFVTHFMSLIAQGVFAKFPQLKVLFTGGGVTWLTAILWRFDAEYMPYRRETPWVKKTPSEYVRDNVRVCTYPLDGPADPERLRRLLRAFPGMEDVLVYGSGYPNWDTNWREEVEAQLPPEWAEKVFAQNAREFFRWDSRPGAIEANDTAGVGEMEDAVDLAHAE
jgi:predicted TIM-barrel fold metal-dependent hydrolase